MSTISKLNLCQYTLRKKYGTLALVSEYALLCRIYDCVFFSCACSFRTLYWMNLTAVISFKENGQHPGACHLSLGKSCSIFLSQLPSSLNTVYISDSAEEFKTSKCFDDRDKINQTLQNI